jgi:hypothetical protein
MRLLFLLLFSSTAFAQDYSYTQIIYHHFPADSTNQTLKTWRDTFSLKGAFMKIHIDSGGRKLYLPRLKLIQTSRVDKDLITGHVTTHGVDTVLTVTGIDTLPLRATKPVVIDEDGFTHVYLKNGSKFMLWGDWATLAYRSTSKWMRVVEYTIIKKQRTVSN